MKRFLQGLVLAGLMETGTIYGATNATVHFFCLSLRFQPATANSVTLELSTASASAPANGELAPVFDPTQPNHGSGFFLKDPTLFGDTPASGTIFFDSPPFSDVNSNGFDDFYEVSQTVPPTVTAGIFDIPGVDNGTVTATWSRAAGAPTGTCALHLEAMAFGDLGTYTHSFQLLEYTGPLSYTPGSNTVTGTLALTQTGASTNTLAGAVVMHKVATNRFNELILQPGAWTNASNQSLTFTNSLILRDTASGTNYYGTVFFADGDPGTPDPDYQVWALSIDDPNDSNHNGIPDFSDDPASAPAAPRLALGQAGGSLVLLLNGAVGQSYRLQEIASPVQTNWTTVLSVTLTNSLLSVPLPPPASSPVFWRALSP